MIRKEFGKTLGEFGLPHAFWEFDLDDDQVLPLPSLVYYDIAPDRYYADNEPYYLSNKFVVELYTDKKDDSLREKLEAFFIAHEWSFIHEPDYISGEELFREYYEITTH